MKSSVAAILMVMTLASASPAFAAGKKQNKSSITFHLETDANDNPKMIFQQSVGGQTHCFRRSPEISLKDATAFRAFPSEVVGTYGLVLKLKSSAVNRLAALTTANLDRWMISQVNGHAVDAIMIDKPVNDGFIVIWKGVTEADLAILNKDLPQIGAEKAKKN